MDSVLGSLAFYPTVISILLSLGAIVILNIDGTKMDGFKEFAPSLYINNADTARTILSTLIGGIISLTVFSFSMVMITLNQASSNFSPRLLPGLISEKKNQLVLGFYLGSIIFNIQILISITPSGESYTLNVLPILIGIALGIICLALFIYFIHNISSGIQIDNILSKIYIETKNSLNKENKEQGIVNGFSLEDTKYWQTITSPKEGYYQGFSENAMLAICKDSDFDLLVKVCPGDFVMPNYPIMSVSKELQQEDIDKVLDKVIFDNHQSIDANYVYGVNQLTEVGVRSMSPGINDPATALNTLDYLSVILYHRMQIKDHKNISTEDKSNIIHIRKQSFERILRNCYASYRQYAKHDLLVMKKMLNILKHLEKQKSIDRSYNKAIKDQIEILLKDAKVSITNEADLRILTSISEN